jgi:outer membrane lipoprotein-sorting protein
LERLAAAHKAFERGHVEARERLLSALPALHVEQGPRLWPARFFLSNEGILMPRRLLISGVAAVCIIIVVRMFLPSLSPSSALAQTAAALRKIKSYRCQVTFEPSAKTDTKEKKVTGTLYWAAPDSFRLETWEKGKLVQVRVVPTGKPGMEIDHKLETYTRLDPAVGNHTPVFLLGEFGKFRGEADRKLGEERIDGKSAPGFQVAISKVDPDFGDGSLQVWIDRDTSLPVKVVFERTDGPAMRFEAFRWDLPAEKWFELEPPAKYQDKTATAPDEKVQTKEIVKALKIYAKHCGGKYPQAATVYPDVAMMELKRTIGVSDPPTKQQAQSGAYDEVMGASWGLGWIYWIQQYNPDPAYSGKTVGPADKDKVLFRWKLGTGDYQVIYGDLHTTTLTAARLKEIEKR